MNVLGNISNAAKALMVAREKHARLSVDAYLAQFDDASLASFGVNRKQLKSGGNVNFFM